MLLEALSQWGGYIHLKFADKVNWAISFFCLMWLLKIVSVEGELHFPFFTTACVWPHSLLCIGIRVFSQRRQTDTCVISWEINRMNESLQKKTKNQVDLSLFFGILTKKCDYRNSFNINLCFNPCSRSWFWHLVRHFFTRQVHWDVWKHFCNEALVEKYSQETCSSASLVIYFLMPSCHSLQLSVLRSVVVSCSACPLHLCRHSSFIISSASSASAESSATAGVWTLWGDQSSPPLTADAPRSQTRRDSIIMYHPLW